MSYYLCSDFHIATIVMHYANRTGLPLDEAQLLADKLKADNIASVNARYDEDEPIEPCSLVSVDHVMSDLGLVGMCDCLDYQSCEPPDYDPSLIGAIRAEFAKTLPPGAKSDTWEIG
jgi:hypothetical protein